MKKKAWSLLLAVLMVISALPVIPAFAADVWDGTSKSEAQAEDGVYQIGNAAELAWFAEQTKTNPNISAVLTDDIDLGANEWSPIGLPASGYVSEAFAGAFDGRGHTISGLSIHTSSAFYGLFYCVYGGTVQNLNVIGEVFTTGNTAGGIVGKLQGGTVENCSFSGKVSAKGNYAGGIVAAVQTNNNAQSSIIGCCNAGEINGKYAGGILGYTTAKANITGCYNTGTINGTIRSAGISGQQTTGTISYCYNIGNSNSGICGFSNAVITNCYYLNETVTPGGSAAGYEKITDKAALLDLLNAGGDTLFIEDKDNINDGYPILNWQVQADPEAEINKQNTEKVKAALENLAFDCDTIKEEAKLNLPLEIGECTVEWTSSNTDIISNDGAVVLPDKNIVSVTLTASVTCSKMTQSKDFIFFVWSKNMDAEVYLDEILKDMEWDFKLLQPVYGEDTNILVKFQNMLKRRGFDGVTVTIKSTADISLITRNGKIHYPPIDENSFLHGKQAQVYFSLTFGGKTVTYPQTGINAILVPWDTSGVIANLESSSDELLTEENICNGESYTAATKDLNLPSNLGSGKYGFAWIEWQSSDEAHLKISNENRESGADSLYNSYVGKVYQDAEEHTVTLTAMIQNPSTEAFITRAFDITIPAMSDGALHQSLDMMSKILDCYTADKLTDSAAKQSIDVNAVDNDIQLVIPSEVVTAEELAALEYGKYWDSWNYKFTAESSDTNVIEIHSFRAFVYRPLGEDSSADKTVTLTIKMSSKANPNLFVTKDIAITVKHLSRQELNDAMSLMDTAKFNYEKGLLGRNADAYTIIDSLTPYKEIVWNSDKSDVDFIYRHDGIKGNGIIVDTLPNWEEQEDWRLFRTSNKDLLANETLILNHTPSEDAFVKINSVLTDETFGKYYTKFQSESGYDVEALAKFKQLYKQPVSAYVMVLGNGNYDEAYANMAAPQKASMHSAGLLSFKKEIDKPIRVTFTLLGLNGEVMIPKAKESSFTKGATVFDVFQKMIADHNMYYASKGSYISSINGLAEKAHGASSGWMYTVDKVFVNSYMNGQELSGGEDILVMYVTDYSKANLPKDTPGDNDNPSADQGNTDNPNDDDNKQVGNNQKPDNQDNGGKTDQDNSSVLDDTNKTERTEASRNTGNTDNPAENENTNSDNAKKDTGKNRTPMIIGFVLCLLILVLIILLFINKKKNEIQTK